MRSVWARAGHGVVSAVAEVGYAALLQPRAHLRAVTISQPVVHDGAREAVVLNQDQRMTNVVVIVAFATGALQSLRNIHCNEKFVFDDEDRAPSECGMRHDGPMRG